MNVAAAVGRALALAGVDTVFGVVGSGNYQVTNALVASGARYVAARHEGGAATMADAYARMSGTVGVLSVHQGPGLTNAMTGLTEAAKSRTPLVVLAAEASQPHSNFFVDQAGLAVAVGAVALRVSVENAVQEALTAFRVAWEQRRTVLLNLPLDVQAADAGDVEGRLEILAAMARDRMPSTHAGGIALSAGTASPVVGGASPLGGGASPVGVPSVLAEALSRARRPVFVAGRGARGARRELEALADATGALLATSAVAKGLFRGSPWDLDISGGFATPLAVELIQGADLVVGWGCALNMWTTRHGTLLTPGTKIAQVDVDPDAIGRHVSVDLGVQGDVASVAQAVLSLVKPPDTGKDHPPEVRSRPPEERHHTPEERSRALEGRSGTDEERYRTDEMRGRIAGERRWRDVPYTDETGDGRIDPRTLTIGLDDLLPAERVIATDSGNFMGYPAMFLDVPDENGFCFTQAFQSIGLGLASAIGAALAHPGRLPVAALGDGGALMGISELETVVRLRLPMVIVIYDDEGYGAEVHHFTDGPRDTITFPPTDFAAIARGYGCAAVTVTAAEDLVEVANWLKGPRDRPLLVHAKVTKDHGSWWLEEAFKGH